MRGKKRDRDLEQTKKHEGEGGKTDERIKVGKCSQV